VQAPVDGQPITVWAPFQNPGHQPATESRISYVFDVIDMPASGIISDLPPIDEDICKKYPPNFEIGVIFPGGGAGNFFASTRDQNIFWNMSLNDNKALLRLNVCISYLTFEKRHYTWYCEIFPASFTIVVDNTERRLGAVCPGRNAEGAN
jgi:hypothetical protein